MVRFLFILLVVLLIPAAGWLLMRRVRHPEGPMTVFDVRRLKERSRRSPRLEAALVLRVSIAEEAEKAGLPDPTPSVDPAIRALERQEDLLEHLERALAETSRAELQAALDDAKVERELAQTTELVKQKQERVDGLAARLTQLSRLEARQQELREAADRLIFGIRGLHLALLERASEAAAGADPLTDARAALEQTRLHTPRIDDAEVQTWSQKKA
ncbi:MAG: hypothetical protein IPG45_17040 [Deltaproteobacteria bacterium]|jgi:DNA repair exonuclease SbcCD ATPase subunit|nr:hypothetical protein [Deltaproteobacteria bacterium]